MPIKTDNKLWLLLIVFLAIFAFSPSLLGGYLNWDDTIYISMNKLVKSELNFDSFIDIYNFDKNISLVLSSFLVENSIWGLNPFISHLINLIFHILNTFLIYRICLALIKKQNFAIIAAILFVIHPLKVESVSWLIQRKDLFFTFFYLSSLLLYLKHKEKRNYVYLVLIVILSYLAIMSKIQAIILPLSILLLEYFTTKTIKLKSIAISSLWLLTLFTPINNIPRLLILIAIPVFIIYRQDSVINFFKTKLISINDKEKYVLIKSVIGISTFFGITILLIQELKNILVEVSSDKIISITTAYIFSAIIIFYIILLSAQIFSSRNKKDNKSKFIAATNNLAAFTTRISSILFKNINTGFITVFLLILVDNIINIYILAKPSLVSNALISNTIFLASGLTFFVFQLFTIESGIKKQKNKAIYLLSAIPILLLAFMFIKNSGTISNFAEGLTDRLLLMSYSLNYYTCRFFAPFNLNAMNPYPSPEILHSIKFIIQPIILIIIIVALALGLKRIKNKELKSNIIFGLLFFLLNILIVLHLIPINGKVVVADRYTYLAHFGLIFSTVAILVHILENRIRAKKIIIYAGSLILIIFSIQTFTRTKIWNNNLSFWSDAIEKNPNNDYAHYSLGLHYYQENLMQEAINSYTTALDINNKNFEYFSNRAACYVRLNQDDLALHDFNSAISINSQDYSSFNNRGILRLKAGQLDSAKNDLKIALSIWAEYEQAKTTLNEVTHLLNLEEKFLSDSIPCQELSAFYENIGIKHAMKNDFKQAILFFDKAIYFNEFNINSLSNRGNCYAALRDFSSASRDYNTLLEIKPNDGGAYLNLANISHQTGNIGKACQYWNKALDLGVVDAQIMINKFCQ